MATDTDKNKIVQITKELLNKVGFDGDVKFIENDSTENRFSTVSVESDNDLSMLIGKNGQNLSAFEHIIRLVATRKLDINGADFNFIIDVNDYRKSRTNYLVGLAKDAAQRVIQTRRAEALLPMSSYERRLVHTELAANKEIQTESIGQEPRRRIIVKPQLEQF
ncbi:MAG: R3H domain-containing nucleic acid-binding protein [Candidatus Paceibacterota bacterium]